MLETFGITRDELSSLYQLPDWLRAARDGKKVCAALRRIVPEFARKEWLLKACDAGHFHFKRDNWAGTYELTVARPGEPDAKAIAFLGKVYAPGVLSDKVARSGGAFGAEGWSAVIPSLNLELQTVMEESLEEALTVLTDPEESRRFLESKIREREAYRDLQIAECVPNVVRYKPGSRCTIVYRLGYSPDAALKNAPEVVVAKTYRGEKGRNAYESMVALWELPIGSSRTVSISEPLAYEPERRILIQGPVHEETTLKALMKTAFQAGAPETMAELEDYFRKTAVGLAELHQSGVRLGKKFLWEDQMAEARERLERLAVAVPELAVVASPLLDRFDELAAQSQPDPLVPTHGSFRPAQVLLYQGQIGFIDFNSFCQSEPAYDLASNLCAVMSIGLTAHDDLDDEGEREQSAREQMAFDLTTLNDRYEKLSGLCSRFLEAYEQHAPISRERLDLWQAIIFFMFVLGGWGKIKIDDMSFITFIFDRFLRTRT